MRCFSKRLYEALGFSLLVLALSGCAEFAYRDGTHLVAQNKVEEGLLRLKEASDRDPGNARYQAAFLHARDRHATRKIDEGERALERGRVEAARAAFERAISIDPGNERARQGLRAVDAQLRHEAWIKQAQELVAKADYPGARVRLRAILVEQPGHVQAQGLLSQIEEKTAPQPTATGLAAAYRQPITIEFRDAPLRQVFELISRRSGLNFLFDKDVRADQRTSIFLKNSTVESAIYYLLVTNQLEQQVMDENTILIFPNVAAKVKEYQQMVVKTFYLANADAKTVANTLKTILKTRDVAVDEKLNLVIVRDSEDAVRLAEKLVALQDVAEAEVMLEVEILEIKRSRLMELGVEWPESLAFAPLQTQSGGPLTIDDVRNLNSSRIGVSGLSAAINASKVDSDTNILANPRIRVRNKEKARILIGEKVPNITTTVSPGSGGFASESVTYVDVGLTLNVEPTIYLDNEVGIRIALEVSNLVDKQTTKSGTVAYQIGTRQASTFLQLKDGENQVLAGLINNEERSSGSKLPGAGDLPLIGRLFGSTLDDNQKTEIVLSITPHLIRTVQRPPASSSEFSSGTETSFRRRPDTSERQPAKLAPTVPGKIGTVAPAIAPGLNVAQPLRQPMPAAQPAMPPNSRPMANPQLAPDMRAVPFNVTTPQPLPPSQSVVDTPPQTASALQDQPVAQEPANPPEQPPVRESEQ